ncbi:MAG: aminopeptidase P N-terminal domain-containing protein [Alphaproteobacteria bacterium]|nr:aminopeptidase P N-terminal domain-containing protein [Alphaproteobacteria bacterium]
MFAAHVHADRRQRLLDSVPGPLLFVGHGERPRNLPANAVPFRQDSTFWYLTGCALPDAALWLEDGRAELYLPVPGEEDALWHGPTPPPEALRDRYGVDAVLPLHALPGRLQGRSVRTLAVADAARTAELARWTGQALAFGREHGDPELVQAVIALRRTKGPEELDSLRRVAALTARAHVLTMAATRPGITERALTAVFEACLASHGAVPGYATILTQDGQVLHHHGHEGTCTEGRLLLLDGGGEWEADGYGADLTRTWPVSGRFTSRQRSAYEAVLAAQEAAIARCRAGVRYREVHDAACLVLARWLIDEGLLRGLGPDEAVERGAHALFFPHGIGHLLGLDVHDLENFGDLPAYPPGQGRPEAFGTRNLRLDLPLEPGWVVTIEPGFYVVPEILGQPALRDRFRHVLDLDAVAAWAGFGGIRIEDDVVITAGLPEVLTEAAPKAVAAVEAAVGVGTTLEALLA